MTDPFGKAKLDLAAKRTQQESKRQELRSRFFSDAVKAAQGNSVKLSYVAEAIECSAINEEELVQVRSKAERYVEAHLRHWRSTELSNIEKAASAAYVTAVSEWNEKRTTLAKERAVAKNNHSAAVGALQLIHAMRQDHPEFADVVVDKPNERTVAKKRSTAVT